MSKQENIQHGLVAFYTSKYLEGEEARVGEFVEDRINRIVDDAEEAVNGMGMNLVSHSGSLPNGGGSVLGELLYCKSIHESHRIAPSAEWNASVTVGQIPGGWNVRDIHGGTACRHWPTRTTNLCVRRIPSQNSQVRAWGQERPAKNAARLARQVSPIAVRVSWVALPTCGSMNTFSRSR